MKSIPLGPRGRCRRRISAPARLFWPPKSGLHHWSYLAKSMANDDARSLKTLEPPQPRTYRQIWSCLSPSAVPTVTRHRGSVSASPHPSSSRSRGFGWFFFLAMALDTFRLQCFSAGPSRGVSCCCRRGFRCSGFFRRVRVDVAVPLHRRDGVHLHRPAVGGSGLQRHSPGTGCVRLGHR